MKALTPFFKWAALVLALAVLLVAGGLGLLYARTTAEDLPQYTPRFAGQELTVTGYDWFIPVIGRGFGRSFSQPDSEGLSLPEVLTEKPRLEVPAQVDSRLEITDEAGQTVFSGTAREYDTFDFTRDGSYTALLTLASPADAPAARPAGSYRYAFTFRLEYRPVLTLSAETAVQGSVVRVSLDRVLGDIPPSIRCELAPEATFLRQGDRWVCFLPVDVNREKGDYPLTVQVGGHQLEATLHVKLRDHREQDSYTLDGTARIPFIGKAPAPVAELFSIADPEIYWSGAFTQPVTGQVVRDCGIREYVNRISDKWVIRFPPLIHLQNLFRPRDSINVTFAVPPESPVVAPAAGRVVLAQRVRGGGQTLVIEHGGGLKTILYLLESITVPEGSAVAQGDVIAATGEYICCEMRLYDIPISPWEVWRGQGGLF